MADEVKSRYIFPDFLAQTMAKIPVKVQYEGAMMSTTLIMIGLVLSGVYFIGFYTFPLWYKIVLVVNVLAGLMFMYSNLVSTFQAYQAICETLEFQEKENNQNLKGGM